MASSHTAPTRNMRSSAFTAYIQPLFQNLAAATSQFNAHPSQHGQTISIYQSVRWPVDSAVGGLRRWHLRAISGQLGAWDMVELVAICGLLGFLGFWRRNKAAKGGIHGSQDPPIKRLKEVSSKAAEGPVTSRDSITGECFRRPSEKPYVQLRWPCSDYQTSA